MRGGASAGVGGAGGWDFQCVGSGSQGWGEKASCSVVSLRLRISRGISNDGTPPSLQ